jgi:alcohol dehydrogenase (cytochrome c)
MRRILPVLLALAALKGEQVPYERILRAASEPGEWPTYSGTYSGQRYSALNQITVANANRLRPAWIHQIRARERFETSPLVIDGVMYLTEPGCRVTALDAKTGAQIWTYECKLPPGLSLCCGSVNRGLAVLGDMLYYETLHARLVALEMKTGRVRWDVAVADYRQRYSSTGAPLAIRDKIFAGVAGGEFGVRGFLDAYDAKSGKRIWRFWTVPGPGEPGHDTWGGESWKTGGVPTWITGSYDPELNLVYWGLGNPAPLWNATPRPGDNLYANSLVALDADTGKLKWYFQFTPGDDHDWDSNHVPVLVDRVVRGRTEKQVLVANRNGFYYALNRQTGQFLVGKPYVKQNWAEGLDPNGRPLRLPNSSPTVEGTLTYPGAVGATNWYSPSYNPQTDLFYIPACEGGDIFYQGEAEFAQRGLFMAGGTRPISGQRASGAIKAIRPDSGEVAWEFKLYAAPKGGVLSTAGGVLFGSSNDGYFFALDARTGKLLWRLQMGEEIHANPITFAVGRRQHVSIAAGHAIFTFTAD